MYYILLLLSSHLDGVAFHHWYWPVIYPNLKLNICFDISTECMPVWYAFQTSLPPCPRLLKCTRKLSVFYWHFMVKVVQFYQLFSTCNDKTDISDTLLGLTIVKKVDYYEAKVLLECQLKFRNFFLHSDIDSRPLNWTMTYFCLHIRLIFVGR